MTEAALEIHGQTGRGRHAPRGRGRDRLWSVSVRSPIPPLPLLVQQGLWGAGAGTLEKGPSTSAAGEGNARHPWASWGLVSMPAHRQPRPLSVLWQGSLRTINGEQRGLGKGNTWESPPLLSPNLLGATTPPPHPRPQPQAQRSSTHCSWLPIDLEAGPAPRMCASARPRGALNVDL